MKLSETNQDFAVRIRVGAFGKHPAWKDFADGLGDESELIARAKGDLLGAIGHLVEAKEWITHCVVPSSPAQNWHFLWQMGYECLAGVMWPSQDDEGRDEYPMVLVAQMDGFSPVWIESRVLPVLIEIASKIRAVSTPRDVNSCLKEAKESLLALARSDAGSDVEASRAALAILAATIPAEDTVQTQRLFHAISANYQPLAAGSSVRSEKLSSDYNSLRLPCPPGQNQVLSGWMAVLQTQITTRASLFAIQPEGESWCDLFVGRIPHERLSLIQKTPTDASMDTDTPYKFDEAFAEKVSRALSAIRVPWGREGKETIFGLVAKDYSASVAPARGRVARAAVTSKSRPISNRRWGYALGAFTVALFAAGTAWWFLRSDSQSPTSPGSDVKKKAADFVVATPPSPTSEGEESRKTQWFVYVNDYERWLSLFSKQTDLEQIRSDFLVRSWRDLVSTNPGVYLDPLEAIKEKDPETRLFPDPKRLANEDAALRQAYRVRDLARTLITREYPATVGSNIISIGTAGMTNIAADLRRELELARSGVLNAVAVRTNAPARKPEPRGDISVALSKLAAVDQAAGDLVKATADWQRARDLLATTDTNYLRRMVYQIESALPAATNLAQAVSLLGGYRQQTFGIEAWLNSNRTNLDFTAFESVERTNLIATLDSWTNRAAEYLRLLPRQDLRNELRNAVVNSRLAGYSNEIFAASASGQLATAVAAPLLQRWSNHVFKVDQLASVPSLQKNLKEITSQVGSLRAEHREIISDLEKTWNDLIDLDKLLAQQRVKALGEPLDVLWKAYLVRVETTARNKGNKLSPADLVAWRGKCDSVHQFLVASLRESNAPPWNLQRPEPSQPNSLLVPTTLVLALVQSNYLSHVATNAVDSVTLALSPPPQADLAGPMTKWWNAYLENDKALRNLLKNRDIPSATDLERMASNSLAALKPPDFLAAIVNNQEILRSPALVRKLTSDPLKPVAQVNTQGSPREIATITALVMAARLDQSPLWPKDEKEWREAVRLAIRLQQDNPKSQWSGWLDRQWLKAFKQAQTFETSAQFAAAASDLKLGKSNFPPSLALNVDLRELRTQLTNSTSDTWPAAIETCKSFLLKYRRMMSSSNSALLDQITAEPKPNAGESMDGLESAPPRLAGARVSVLGGGRVAVEKAGCLIAFRRIEVPYPLKPFFLAESELSSEQLAALSKASYSAKHPMFQEDSPAPMVNSFQDELLLLWRGDRYRFNRHALFALHNLVPMKKEKTDNLNGTCVEVRTNRFPLEGKVSVPQAFLHVSNSYPANFITPAQAEAVGRALGCRLPTPEEWKKVDEQVNARLQQNSPAIAVSQLTDGLLRKFARPMGIELSNLKGKMLFGKESPISLVQGGGLALEPQLFAGVTEGNYSDGQFYHWRGNVRELLKGEGKDGKLYYVAGGGFASSHSSEPEPWGTRNYGCADVGLRLAFDFTGESPVERIHRLAASIRPDPLH